MLKAKTNQHPKKRSQNSTHKSIFITTSIPLVSTHTLTDFPSTANTPHTTTKRFARHPNARTKSNPGNLSSLLANISSGTPDITLKSHRSPFYTPDDTQDISFSMSKRDNQHLDNNNSNRGNKFNKDNHNNRNQRDNNSRNDSRDSRGTRNDSRGSNNHNDNRTRDRDGGNDRQQTSNFHNDFDRRAFLNSVNYKIPAVLNAHQVLPLSARKIFLQISKPAVSDASCRDELQQYADQTTPIHDPVLDTTLYQHAAGLTRFVAPHKPLHAVVKKYFEDFIVQEIDLNDDILSLHPLSDSHTLAPEDVKNISTASERTRGLKMLDDAEAIAIACTELEAIVGKDHVAKFMKWYQDAANFVKDKQEANALHTSLYNHHIYNLQLQEASAKVTTDDIPTDKPKVVQRNGFIIPSSVTFVRPIPKFKEENYVNNPDVTLECPDYLKHAPINDGNTKFIKQTVSPAEHSEISAQADGTFVAHVIEHVLTKEQRTAIHTWVKAHFGLYLVSDAQEINGTHYIRLTLVTQNGKNTHMRSDLDYRSSKSINWYPGLKKPYLCFTMEKRDIDSLSALNNLVKKLGKNPMTVSSAGIKDRRAVTVQRCSLQEVTAPQLLRAIYGPLYTQSVTNKILREVGEDVNEEVEEPSEEVEEQSPTTVMNDGEAPVIAKKRKRKQPRKMNYDGAIENVDVDEFNSAFDVSRQVNMVTGRDFTQNLLHVGQFEYRAEPIMSGQLRGNRFTIALRDIAPNTDYLALQSTITNPDTVTSPDLINSAAIYTGNNKKDRISQDDTTPDGDAVTKFSTIINYNTPYQESFPLYDLHQYYKYSPEQVADTTSTLMNTFDSLGNNGFINYFGEQRFGRFWNSYILGYFLQTGRYKQFIQTMLAPKAGERADLRQLKQYLVGEHVNFPKEQLHIRDSSYTHRYLEGGWDLVQAQRMASRFPPSQFTTEKQLVNALIRHGPRDFHGIINSGVPSAMQSLYLHAYQSYIWNNAASARFDPDFMGMDIKELQLPIIGDVVLIKGVAPRKVEDMIADEEAQLSKLKHTKIVGALAARDGKVTQSSNSNDISLVMASDTAAAATEEIDAEASAAAEDDAKTLSFNSQVHIVTEDDVKEKKYSIHDVILPVPGVWTYFPTHKAGKLMLEALGTDGILLLGKRFNDDGTSNNNNEGFYIKPADADVDINSVVKYGQKGFPHGGSYRQLVKKPFDLDYLITFSAAKINKEALHIQEEQDKAQRTEQVETQLAMKKSFEATSATSAPASSTVEDNELVSLEVGDVIEKKSLTNKKKDRVDRDFTQQFSPEKVNYFFSFDRSKSLYTLHITQINTTPLSTEKKSVCALESTNIADIVTKATQHYQQYAQNAELDTEHILRTNMMLKTKFNLDPSTYATVLSRELLCQSPYTYTFIQSSTDSMERNRESGEKLKSPRGDDRRGDDRRGDDRGGFNKGRSGFNDHRGGDGRDNNRGTDRRDNTRGGNRDNNRGADRRDNTRGGDNRGGFNNNRGGDRRDNNRGRDNSRR